MSPAPANALRFKRALLKWFRANGRDLPWRATRDPYRIAVSEFMLQQTQVSRVLDYYPRFLRRFPTLEALAKARPRAVREAWEGLGYYRRAENLHRLARTVVREHAGTIPAAPEELE
ncbi:MAG: A/G-specific adenine glycosylase, partial [Gemmatimonadota bacterium]|nr:A/G-specific adenine glycosylase [Gemmatimonadota bacterium]